MAQSDQRLDQVSTITDFDYALIVKGSDVKKISKADLASVVGRLIGVECVSTIGSPANLQLAFQNKPYYITVTSLSNFAICGIYHAIHNGRGNNSLHVIKEMSGISLENDTIKYAGGNGECIITALCMGL